MKQQQLISPLEINGEIFKRRAISNEDEQFYSNRFSDDETKSSCSSAFNLQSEEYNKHIGEFMSDLIKLKEFEDEAAAHDSRI